MHHRYLFTKINLKEVFSIFFAFKIIGKPDEKKTSIFNITGSRSALARFSRINLLFYAWVVLYIADAVALILYASLPLFFILILRKLSKDKYYLTRKSFFLSITAFVFVVLLIFSNSSGEFGLSPSAVFALPLLIVGIICNTQYAVVMKIANDFSKRFLVKNKNTEMEESDIDMGCTLLLSALTAIIAIIIGILLLVIFFSFNIGFTETLPLSGIVLILIFSAIIQPIGLYADIRGVKSSNSGIQSIKYLTPALGVIFLVIFDFLDTNLFGSNFDFANAIDVNWLWISIALCGIILANLFIGFETKKDLYNKDG